jgi:acyl carrier protein
LGGHSLLAAQIYACLQEEFNVELPIETLFEESNIAAVAALIESIRITEYEGKPQVEVQTSISK